MEREMYRGLRTGVDEIVSVRSESHRRTRALPFAATLLLMLVAVSWAANAASARSAKAASSSLTVAVAVTGTPFTPLYLAQSLGYFKQAGVNVKFDDNASATGVALLTSHQADLFVVGPGAVFSLNQQGQPTSIIYNMDSGGTGSIEVLGNSPVKNLMQLSGQRVGSLTVGGSSYGDASAYSNYIVKHGGKPMQIVPLGNQTDLIDALMSGSVSATVDSRSWFASQITSGQVRLAVNTTDTALVKKLGVIPEGISETGIFGLNSDLAAKRSTIVRFLQAVAKAAEYAQAHSPTQIAASLVKLPDFTGMTAASVALSETFDKPFLSPDFGTVPQATWTKQLASYAEWGLEGVNITPQAFPFNKVVNMSYLYAALSSLSRTYTAQKGDTLRSVSEVSYGTPTDASVIKEANPALKSFTVNTKIKKPTKLKIPALKSLAAAAGR
jgi:ABC-type nitrate/sulfonate/bicarbonate transport system substrate-binding protein